MTTKTKTKPKQPRLWLMRGSPKDDRYFLYFHRPRRGFSLPAGFPNDGLWECAFCTKDFEFACPACRLAPGEVREMLPPRLKPKTKIKKGNK